MKLNDAPEHAYVARVIVPDIGDLGMTFSAYADAVEAARSMAAQYGYELVVESTDAHASGAGVLRVIGQTGGAR